MSISLTNFVFGLAVVMGSFMIARLFAKRWQKITIIALGAILAAVCIFFSPFSKLINSPKLPTDTEILALLYGPETVIQTYLDGKTVYIVEQLTDTEREQFHYAAQVNIQIVHKQRGWERDPRQLIVLTKTGPPDCCDRSFLPVLGGAILIRENDSWQVDSYQKLIMPFNGFDLLSKSKIVEIGPQKTALAVQDQADLDGVTQIWDVFIIAIEGQLKPVAKIQTRANNQTHCPPVSEAEPCWEYSAKYDLVAGENLDYDDIEIITSGTKLVDGILTSFEKSEKLEFIDGTYQLKND